MISTSRKNKCQEGREEVMGVGGWGEEGGAILDTMVWEGIMRR